MIPKRDLVECRCIFIEIAGNGLVCESAQLVVLHCVPHIEEKQNRPALERGELRGRPSALSGTNMIPNWHTTASNNRSPKASYTRRPAAIERLRLYGTWSPHAETSVRSNP